MMMQIWQTKIKDGQTTSKILSTNHKFKNLNAELNSQNRQISFNSDDYTEQRRIKVLPKYINPKVEKKISRRQNLVRQNTTLNRYQCFCTYQFLSYCTMHHHLQFRHKQFFERNRNCFKFNVVDEIHPLHGYIIKKMLKDRINPYLNDNPLKEDLQKYYIPQKKNKSRRTSISTPQFSDLQYDIKQNSLQQFLNENQSKLQMQRNNDDLASQMRKFSKKIQIQTQNQSRLQLFLNQNQGINYNPREQNHRIIPQRKKQIVRVPTQPQQLISSLQLLNQSQTMNFKIPCRKKYKLKIKTKLQN